MQRQHCRADSIKYFQESTGNWGARSNKTTLHESFAKAVVTDSQDNSGEPPLYFWWASVSLQMEVCGKSFSQQQWRQLSKKEMQFQPQFFLTSLAKPVSTFHHLLPRRFDFHNLFKAVSGLRREKQKQKKTLGSSLHHWSFIGTDKKIILALSKTTVDKDKFSRHIELYNYIVLEFYT